MPVALLALCQRHLLAIKTDQPDAWVKLHRAFRDLTVAALRCDLTRVACLGWTGGSWQFTFPTDGEAQVQDGANCGPFKDEHGIAHDV